MDDEATKAVDQLPFFWERTGQSCCLEKRASFMKFFFGKNWRHPILVVFWKFFNFGSKNEHIEYCALHIGGWSNKGYNSVAVFGKRSDQSSCSEKMKTICWLLLVKICCHLTINLFFANLKEFWTYFANIRTMASFSQCEFATFFSQKCCENLNDGNISRMFEFVDLDKYILRCAWSTLPANFWRI